MKIRLSILTFLLLCTSISSFAQGWDKIFPDTQIIIAPGFAIGFEVEQTNDGGYILGGEVDYATGAIRHYARIIKTDAFGNTAWDSTYHEWDIISQEVQLLNELPDGNFIVGGSQNGTPYLMKINQNGIPLWEKTFPSDTIQHTMDGVVCPDGGFLLTGYLTPDFGIPSNIFLIKTDSDGAILWQRKHIFTNYAIANSVDNTADGGFILVGVLDNTVTLFKMDAMGNLEWEREYSFSTADNGLVVKQTSDNGFIVGGSSTGIIGNFPLVFKTDPLGNGEWSAILPAAAKEQVTDIALTPDGGYAVVGAIQSFWSFNNPGGFLIKLDEVGEEEWTEDFSSTNQRIAAVANTSDGGFILAGRDDTGMLLKKIGGTTSQKNISSNTSIEVFPNPTTNQTTFYIQGENLKTIQLQVFDSMGKLVRVEKHDSPSFVFDVKKLPSGIYFYHLKNENSWLGNGKLIIAK